MSGRVGSRGTRHPRLTRSLRTVRIAVVLGPHRVHRLIAATLLVVLAVASPALALCTGWANSPAERMACCEHEGAGCASISADSCCADGEQRQNVESPAAVVIVEDSSASEAVSLAADRQASTPSDPRALAARPDTYLLDSVFRI